MSTMNRALNRAVVVLLSVGATVGCGEPQCPSGYTKKNDTCYRSRDGGSQSTDEVKGDDSSRDAGPEGGSGGDAAVDDVDAHAPPADTAPSIDGGVPPADAASFTPVASDAGSPDALVTATEAGSSSSAPTNSADAACGDCGIPPACRVRACNGTSCSETNADLGTTCNGTSGAGVCNGTGRCVGCNEDADCVGKVSGADACHDAACVGNACTTRVKPWARCSGTSVCNANGTCAAACGNGHVDLELEECDPTASGGDTWSCNKNTCRLTGLSGATSYHRCATASDCATGETCKATALVIGLVACIPTCTTPLGLACPFPPGYRSWIVGDEVACDDNIRDCFVLCANTGECPPGTTCQNGICYGPL